MPKVHLAVLDSETDPFDGRTFVLPFVVGLYDGTDYIRWWGNDCMDKVVEYLRNKEWTVYAHNGSKFDYHFMLHHLADHTSVRVIANRLAEFNIGKCTYRDSMHIMPFGLAQYQKDSIDYQKFTRKRRHHHREEIEAYLKSDCVYLYELVKHFRDDFGPQLTVASASMKHWQKLSGLKPPKTDELYYDKIKPFYFGGRVEHFELGIIDGPFESVDICSAYPWAMQFEHPFNTTMPVELDPKSLSSFYDIHPQSFYDIEAIAKGCLPWRDDKGETSYPVDVDTVRRFYVTGWEVQAGLDTDSLDIKSINAIYHCTDTINFKEFVTYHYEARKTAKEMMAKHSHNKDSAEYKAAMRDGIFSKYVLNSLYGKFAADPRTYAEFLTIHDEEDIPLYEEAENFNFNGILCGNILLSKELDEDKHRFFNVATSASITGCVRAYMWRALYTAKRPIYCDTDCIVAESVSCELGTELGQWEVEGQYSGGGIGGKKLYAFRYRKRKNKTWYKTASKGVRLTPGQILKVAKGERVKYKPIAPTYSIHRPPAFVDRWVERKDIKTLRERNERDKKKTFANSQDIRAKGFYQ